MSQSVPAMNAKPSSIPITGDKTMKINVLVHPEGMRTPNPAFATALPAYPPINACEELVGKPRYQVMMFQAIAPNSPAKMTVRSTELMSIIPDPTVLATPTPKPIAAAKLKKAAQATALPGDRTRVD